MSADILRPVLRIAGYGTLADGAGLDRLVTEATRLLQSVAEPARADALAALLRAWLWNDELARLRGRPRESWAAHLVATGVARHLGAASLAHVLGGAGAPVDDEAALVRAAARELLLERLAALGDQELRDRVIADTAAAVAVVDALRDEAATAFGERVRHVFPEVAALAVAADAHASVEHERDPAGRPLLDHLGRVLERKLAGLEVGDRACFQRGDALSAAAFDEEVARLARVRAAGLLPCVRAALVHLDFAKGGTPAEREAWAARLGVDLSVHNLAARAVLERATPPGADRPGVLGGFTLLRAQPALAALALALIESHGLAGQAVRGETPLALFAPFVKRLRTESWPLAAVIGAPREVAIRAAVDALHLVNVCDTAGVREGLATDALRDEMAAVESAVERVAIDGESTELAAIEDELARHEDALWAERHDRTNVRASVTLPGASPADRDRARLGDRLGRLRKGRRLAGEPPERVLEALRALDDAAVARLAALLRPCQLWYCEAATGGLSAEAQMKLLALAVHAADDAPAIDAIARPYHVSLLPLVPLLNPKAGPAAPYRVRLVEALLAPLAIRDILAGATPPSAHLGTFATEIGGTAAVVLRFDESAEAEALLTLLAIYETKSSAAFHTTLKALCDLYDLRKDDFDRVANETAYLAHMNSARSDKARMLDHVRPGRIVEVGPGGGVILDLLEARFPGSEIVGIDISHQVVRELEARRERETRRWRIVEADAFALPERFGAGSIDTVIYCSLLHEIYSYIGPFKMEPVRDLLQATYRALVPGGRIVVRDGVLPPQGVRHLRFLVLEAREFFELFAAQFEGRRIASEPAGPDRVRVSAADAAEFLFKYTWGAASFPYEIREQYCLLPYDEYRDRVLAWLAAADPEHAPRAVPLPAAERSWLQDGYRTGLAGKVVIEDDRGRPCELPDSNALWVYEKG